MPVLLGWLSYAGFFLVFATVFAIITLGLNLQWGFTGLFNVGVAGFVAVGAYTSAILTTPKAADRLAGFGWPVAAGVAAATLVTGLVGLFVGLVALRLRRDYLAITTFGIAVTIQVVANNATPLTGGPFGYRSLCSLLSISPWKSSSTVPGDECCAPFAKTKRPHLPWENESSCFVCRVLSSVAC